MRVENQICSFENATRLKELGIRVHSLFCYVNNWVNPRQELIADGQYIISSEMKHITRVKGRERGVEVDFIPAFTATELGYLLPSLLPHKEYEYGSALVQMFPDGKEQDYYVSSYVEVCSDLDYGGTIYHHAAKTEADSRAGLLLDLIGKGLVKVESINEKWSPGSDTEIF